VKKSEVKESGREWKGAEKSGVKESGSESIAASNEIHSPARAERPERAKARRPSARKYLRAEAL
jgi:hypothetical protein